MIWPKPNKGIPEDTYTFTIIQEPELHVIGTKGSRSLEIVAKGKNAKGEEYQHKERLVPWSKEYAALCEVLNVEHGRDIQVTGEKFIAEIAYEADKTDPEKSWPRLRNIRDAANFEPDKDGDGDIPF